MEKDARWEREKDRGRDTMTGDGGGGREMEENRGDGSGPRKGDPWRKSEGRTGEARLSKME